MPDQLDLHGVLPALITPFTDDGEAIDVDALDAIVERLIAGGVAGLVPGGSTGEFTTLNHDERRRLVEATLAAADRRVPVVAGTGALSTRETIALSVHAEEAGAAAVMVVPPFYDAPRRAELLVHFRAVTDAVTIPVVYYHLPAATGITPDLDLWRALRQDAGVAAVKDTGGDAVTAAALLHAGDEVPTLLNGWDTLTFAALAAGAKGAVWGVASILPEPCVELHRLLVDEADLAAARALWTRLLPLCAFLESQSYPAAVKAACALVGDRTGPVRAPLLELVDDALGELRDVLAVATTEGSLSR